MKLAGRGPQFVQGLAPLAVVSPQCRGRRPTAWSRPRLWRRLSRSRSAGIPAAVRWSSPAPNRPEPLRSGTRSRSGRARRCRRPVGQPPLPLANSTVAISCPRISLATTVATDSTGRYNMSLLAPSGRISIPCSFGVPDLIAPLVRIDTMIGFAEGLHAQQFINFTIPRTRSPVCAFLPRSFALRREPSSAYC